MLVISSREFRQNQKYYLDLVDKNEKIIVQRGKDKSYKIVPTTQNDTVLSEEEFVEKINHSIRQALDGNLSVLTKERQKELLKV